MSKVRGVAEVVLATHDVGRSLEFYRDVLGLTVMSQPGPGQRGPIFLRAGSPAVGVPQMIVLVPLPPESPEFVKPRPLHHLALEIAPEDFDSEKSRLEGLGFQVRTGQHPAIPSRTMYVDDPEGNEVELICTA